MKKTKPQCGLILENGNKEIILQLRDLAEVAPHIEYPNMLGTFGGGIEDGETPLAAIIRESKEEMSYTLVSPEYFGNFPFDGYDIHMFRKVDPLVQLDDLDIKEGQKAMLISVQDVKNKKYEFAFNCELIVKHYFHKFHKANF